MKNVLSKIAEIENKSEQILDDIKKAKDNLPETIKKECELIDSKYYEKHKKIINEKTLSENSLADEKIREIEKSHADDMNRLNEYFEKNVSAWQEDIFNNIIK